MLFLKKVINFYVNSSIHVALAVVSLSWITLLDMNIALDKNLLYFILFASIMGYNFVKYFKTSKFHYKRLKNWLKFIQIFSLISFMFMCYFALKLKAMTLLYAFCFAAMTFFYAIPFLPRRLLYSNKLNLRAVSGLKVYVISFVWMGVTVFLPILNSNYSIDLDVILLAVQRFIFVVVLMLPFEIRDLRHDSLMLETIPQTLGIKRTKIFGFLLLLIFLSLEFFKDGERPKFILSLLVVTTITLLFLVFAKKEQSEYYCSFWVEGIPILWLGLLLVFC